MTNFIITGSNFNQNIVRDLYSKFPHFKKEVDEIVDEEFHYNPYMIFGSYGSWLVDLILKNDKTGAIDESFDFINSLCEQNIDDCNKILQVTFFEHLTDYKITIEAGKVKLKTIALKLFQDVLNGPIFGGGIHAK